MSVEDLRLFVERNHNKQFTGTFNISVSCHNSEKSGSSHSSAGHAWLFYGFVAALVEHVRDGSTLRLLVYPSYTMITVAMSGIKVWLVTSSLLVGASYSLFMSLLLLLFMT